MKAEVKDGMTLVLYIPFSSGAIMISDRQNTYREDLTREPIDKIEILTNLGTVLGFAGPTPQCRYLIDQLRRVEVTSSFEETYREIYQECYGSPELGFRSDDVEYLAVTQRSDSEGFVVRKILGALMNEIDDRKCAAIGGGAKYIAPQLQLNTMTANRERAEEFGLTLLAYSSLIDVSVGSPMTYGYNVVLMGAEIGSVSTAYPESIDITRLLYDFGK